MWGWLWGHLRRPGYKKHSRLEGNEEPGEAEEEEEERRGAEAAVQEGRPPQPQPPSLGRGAALKGAPEGPGKALAAPLPSEGLPPSDGQPPGPALTSPEANQEMLTLVRELEAVREFQASHRQERKKDLRSCQECLKSLKALRDDLQAVQSRLWRVEAKLGMRVSPPEEELEGDGGPFGLGARSVAPTLG